MISPAKDSTGGPGAAEPARAPGAPSSTRDVTPSASSKSRERRLLFLDDDPARAEAFLRENPAAVWVQTVEDCLARLTEPWDEVHLDHDLGGKTYVNSDENDCGMEVIRWLCCAPREHLRQTRFIVHTHNSLAGLLMVLEMRARHFAAEFRPFGSDPASLLAGGDLSALDPQSAATIAPGEQRPAGLLARCLELLKGQWPRPIRSEPPQP